MTTDRSALILIVDDDYDFLEINRMILERAGYRVVTAAEPRQALVKMEAEKPDLIITDLMMTSIDSGFFVLPDHQGRPPLRRHPHHHRHVRLECAGARFPPPLR